MNIIFKRLIILLGFMVLLTVPDGARSDSAQITDTPPAADSPRLLMAGGRSLLATSNPSSAGETDPQAPAPALMVIEPLFEFGRVLEGTVVEHDFLIENRGTGDLRIDQVLTG